ncbi:MAG TPA: haloacid dehalogenase [Planctomycetaceae bacterium]|uniref:HAD family hydrolase n=2 Tax=Gimesia maris TaxID=122 RepID=UPI000E9D44EB|nr:haloacid dehalogenase [Planctomycetaceae bacterium]|tara:strand:+ start:165554 stop:166261 length:708 start_codon:yes stop_codon:yes gene_type:complete
MLVPMHVCLFDIDGTLIDTGGAGQRSILHMLEEVFQVSAPVEGIPTAGRTDHSIMVDLFEFFNIANTSENRQRFEQGYLKLLAEKLLEHQGRVLPGIREILESLSQQENVDLGLLTGNFEQGAKQKLAHYELQQYFDFGAYGDHHADRDDVAHEALRQIRERHAAELLERTSVWVLGDTPNDITCARAIGANVIAVATGVYSLEELRQCEPDYLFEHFEDVHAVLTLFEPPESLT